MNTKLLTAVSAAVMSAALFAQAPTDVNATIIPAPGGVSALNGDPTGAYAPSRVETKLNVEIKEGTNAVHFIRDNNDPYVVTKAYLLKHADPYIIRNVLRRIVASSISDNPVGVESVKYYDGVGVILVSAEEYRFKDAGNGMSIDEIVANLDKEDLPNSVGTADYAYFPRYNSADTLLSMMMRSGIGFSNVVPTNRTTWFSENKLNPSSLGWVETDENMNALIMTLPGFDMKEALDFLKAIDTPNPETYMSYKLVEVYAENDQKLGLDFQSWKNNDGVNLFSVGGKYGNNDWGFGVIPNGGNRYAEYFNFNPKWNTKYLDFLTTCGKAKVITSGKIVVGSASDEDVRGNGTNLTISNGIFSVALTKIEDDYLIDLPPVGAEGKSYEKRRQEIMSDSGLAKLLSTFVIQHGNTQEVEPGEENNVFQLHVDGDIHNKASNLNISLSNTSLIGWEGDGTPRLSTSSYSTTIQIGSEAKDFVIGGIEKTSVVRSVSGLPFLKDIPVLGWLFSTESDTVKKSQFVLYGSLEPINPASTISADDQEIIDSTKTKVEKASANPISTTGFQQLLLDD